MIWPIWWTKSVNYLLAVTLYLFQLLIIPLKHLVTHTIGVCFATALVAHPSMRCQPFLRNPPNNAKKSKTSRAHRLGRPNLTFLDATHKALVGISWLRFFQCETYDSPLSGSFKVNKFSFKFIYIYITGNRVDGFNLHISPVDPPYLWVGWPKKLRKLTCSTML